MGKYLTIKLKKEFCDEANLKAINADLMGNLHGCPSQSDFVDYVFNTRESVQDDCDYMNNDYEGKRQMRHVARPITPKVLQSLVIREKDYGYVQVKLSGGVDEREARTAFALAVWAKSPENLEYIEPKWSDNYDFETVEQYCSHALPGGKYIHPKPETPELMTSFAVQPELIKNYKFQPSLF